MEVGFVEAVFVGVLFMAALSAGASAASAVPKVPNATTHISKPFIRRFSSRNGLEYGPGAYRPGGRDAHRCAARGGYVSTSTPGGVKRVQEARGCGVASPRRTFRLASMLRPQHAAIERGQRRRAEQCHGGFELELQDLDHALHTLVACDRESPQV